MRDKKEIKIVGLFFSIFILSAQESSAMSALQKYKQSRQQPSVSPQQIEDTQDRYKTYRKIQGHSGLDEHFSKTPSWQTAPQTKDMDSVLRKTPSWDEEEADATEDVLEQADDQETLSITDLWEQLEISADVWNLIMDRATKQITVERYIHWFSKKGILVRKTPEHYIDVIDSFSQKDPSFLQKSFSDMFRLIAVMEYDYDNGMDRDVLARQVLGEKLYWENRKRLGLD